MPIPKIIHPTFSVMVPTKNEEIWLRPYLVKEQKILLTLSESEDVNEIVQNLKNLISSCIVKPENYNVDTLSVYDLKWLAIMLRKASVGDEVVQNYVCKNILDGEECKGNIQVTFKISDVKFEMPKDSTNVIKINENTGVKLYYPRVNDPSVFSSSDNINSLINMIANDIQAIFTEEETYTDFTKEEAIEFLTSLKINEFEKILDFYKEENQPKIYINVPYTCKKCGNSGVVFLSNLFDFFTL